MVQEVCFYLVHTSRVGVDRQDLFGGVTRATKGQWLPEAYWSLKGGQCGERGEGTSGEIHGFNGKLDVQSLRELRG